MVAHIAMKIRPVFLHAFATCSELPSNMRRKVLNLCAEVDVSEKGTNNIQKQFFQIFKLNLTGQTKCSFVPNVII